VTAVDVVVVVVVVVVVATTEVLYITSSGAPGSHQATITP
jgi:hypothetical protein